MRRWLVILAFLTGLVGPAVLMAQAPPPVPALPDLERRTEYTITGSNCNCPVGFNLYGDATDFGNWIQVFVNGLLVDPATYAITSPTGPLATLPRPITDAVLNFNALTTGEIQIVGGRRPRRTQLFAENRGVAARDLNQLGNDIEAQNRETWDLRMRSLLGPPSTVYGPMPDPATCANKQLTFDSTGLVPVCAGTSSAVSLNVSAGSITNDLLANMPPLTIKCNPTGVSATPQDCISSQSTPLMDNFTISSPGHVPPPGVTTVTTQVFLRGDGQWVSALSPSSPILAMFTSGATGIFTPSPGTLYMAVEMCGGGGGGGPTGTGTTGGDPSPGAVTFFGLSTISTNHLYLETRGGSPGSTGTDTILGMGGLGGISSQGDFNLRGAGGENGPCCGAGGGVAGIMPGGKGAASPFGDGGIGGAGYNTAAVQPGLSAESFCAGGGGAGSNQNTRSGGGGGAGGYLEKLIVQPISPNYLFGAGLGGPGGAAGTSGAKGGNGGNGVLFIRMFFQ